MKDWKIKPRYWDNPQWFVERNQELVKDKESGMSIAELCGKYNITPNRIYHVMNSYERTKDGTR